MNVKNENPKKKGQWLGAAISVLFLWPELIPVAIFAGIIWLVVKTAKKQQGAPKASTTRYTTRQQKYDNCSQPVFCRHRDKAVHHVRRGKEIDPWDRPDIDISKYQRNR